MEQSRNLSILNSILGKREPTPALKPGAGQKKLQTGPMKPTIDKVTKAKAVLNPKISKSGSSYRAVTPIVAIDCEMVNCGGDTKYLARCSIVNYNGHVLFDEFVRPEKKVTDF
jgi:hypothetical protein